MDLVTATTGCVRDEDRTWGWCVVGECWIARLQPVRKGEARGVDNAEG